MNGPSCFLKLLLGLALLSLINSFAARAADNSVSVILIEGTVEVAPAGTDSWAPARLNQKLQVGDKLRTGKLSRAMLRSPSAGDMPVRESSLMTINAPRAGSDRPVVELVRGFFYFFTRGQPTDIDFRNRLASAAARGTEFTVFVDDNDRIEITVFDGIVGLTNAQGGVIATNGEQGVAVAGQAPMKSPALSATNLVQWVLYYPGVLAADELAWVDADKNALSDSLAAYRSGDLVQALNLYPANRQPATDPEKIYRAALMFVVGEVDQAKGALDSVTQINEFSAALRKLIAAVRNDVWPDTVVPQTATGWMAESYYRQSRLDLQGALAAARAATAAAPGFGFAWARVAELEFSFGHIDEALAALEKALALSPRHASALALKGFLLSAQNRIPEAIQQFDEAMAVDSALPDAWLGRGLCRIRRGDVETGREDLRTAAALEPTRAVLRSYLAKAFSDSGRRQLAEHELALSREIDPKDPTVWLYGALHSQQQNKINDAIRQLERSQELNDNRAVYRSEMMLDQDRAVRSANLAGIYNDAGMTDVSVREAGRAVSMDYANYSAHLFLANSYERLRDPKQINLRYETPAFAEYLIANLLAPVGAGPLSPAVSAQEYSKLFERDRLSISSRTEYNSGGNWFEEGAQYGTFGNTAYSVEGLYRSDHGQRSNNDLEQRQIGMQLKHQVTPHDTIYFQATEYRAESGDVTQYFDQDSFLPFARTRETQQPVLVAGYHHEWGPGSHTLFLGTRIDDTIHFRNSTHPILALGVNSNNIVSSFSTGFINENYESQLEIYSGELQQIYQVPQHTTVLGGRFQFGEFDTESFENNLRIGSIFPLTYKAVQNFTTDFQRTSLYGYHAWEIVDSLQIIGGVSYDHVTFPENFRFAPISDSTDSRDQVSPKGGLIWTVDKDTVLRIGYAQALGGASLDQSYQIEPSQIAGFNQSFRSIIPESIAGANAGATFETAAFSAEHRFPTETYVGLSGELLESSLRRNLGVINFRQGVFAGTSGQIRERMDFTEQSLTVTLNQLVGEGWAFGVRYRVSCAELEDDFPRINPNAGNNGSNFRRERNPDSTLHQTMLYAIYNHRCGWFTQLQALWTSQSNDGFVVDEDMDDFWQLNAFTGYRFARRRAEIAVGIVNITDEDYELEPLTLYTELPRERAFVARFSFKF